MRLSELARSVPDCRIIGRGNPEITRVDYDSRQASPGSLFVAIKGARTDGHRFVEQAFANGAAAAAVEERVLRPPDRPLILVPDGRLALALFSGELWGHPDREMSLAGVTGTNGKTTTVNLLADIFAKAWGKSGMIGTLGNRIGDRFQTQERTTPESPDILQLLSQMRAEGCRAAAMEVSSHALALKRVFGLQFSVAAFTNLSQDHLDFHKNFESYFEAKAALFSDYGIGVAVINADDPYGERLLDVTSAPVLKYSLSSLADVQAASIELSVAGIRMAVHTPRGEMNISSPLLGKFNAYNLLCALAVSEALEIPHEDSAAAIASFHGVPGRMQSFSLGNRRAYVDYAHTPEALQLTIEELKSLTPGPVHVLFGCGGNRDSEKRPLMGRIAEERADKVYVTTDNPRDEDPEEVIAEILAGMIHPEKANVIPDRRRAILTALENLPDSGALLIAGKGHENYQEIRGVKYPFDDSEEVRRYIEAQRG